MFGGKAPTTLQTSRRISTVVLAFSFTTKLCALGDVLFYMYISMMALRMPLVPKGEEITVSILEFRSTTKQKLVGTGDNEVSLAPVLLMSMRMSKWTAWGSQYCA